MADETTSAIEAVKSHLSAETRDKLTDQQVFELMKLAGEGKLQAQRLATLTSIAPTLGNVVTEFVKSVPQIAELATASQAKAFDNSRENLIMTVTALENIALECETDAARLEIAQLIGAAHKQTSSGEEGMNSNNNGFFGGSIKYIAGAIGIVGAVALALTNRGGRSA